MSGLRHSRCQPIWTQSPDALPLVITHLYSSKVKFQGHLVQLTPGVFVLNCRAAVRRLLYSSVLLCHQATAFKRSNVKVIGEGHTYATIQLSIKRLTNLTVSIEQCEVMYDGPLGLCNWLLIHISCVYTDDVLTRAKDNLEYFSPG